MLATRGNSRQYCTVPRLLDRIEERVVEAKGKEPADENGGKCGDGVLEGDEPLEQVPTLQQEGGGRQDERRVRDHMVQLQKK